MAPRAVPVFPSHAYFQTHAAQSAKHPVKDAVGWAVYKNPYDSYQRNRKDSRKVKYDFIEISELDPAVMVKMRKTPS
jgi:hypothetical protein